MLRLFPTEVVYPETIDETIVALARQGAKLCAGGTDVVANMKHGLHEPDVLVHLSRVRGLAGVTHSDEYVEIGATTTLYDVQGDAIVRAHAPWLAEAAGVVAGPQLRRMGTVGGNICLDTRCLYYNQSYFWRESLGFCLKKDGSHCHVVDSGKKCVAAASNDVGTMLYAMGAEVLLHSAAGKRWLPLAQFYVADGVRNTVLGVGEIVTKVRFRKCGSAKGGYAKLRHRKSIDYPLLGVAVYFEFDECGIIEVARALVCALAARAKELNCSALVGEPLAPATVEGLAALAQKKIHPLTNIASDPAWRKEMASVLVREACQKALSR